MAKKKVVDVEGEKLDTLASSITEKYGDNVFLSANALLDKEQVVIPVSPAIDIGLGGGIPEGSWFGLTGAPKFGKTSTSLHLAKQAQKEEYGCRDVYFIAVEGRLKRRDLMLPGLNPDKFFIIQSSQDQLLDVKSFLNIVLDILKSKPGCMVIVDSFSSLSHEKELVEGLGASTRGGTNVILTQFCNQVALILPVNKNILVGITHIIANTSGYGAATLEKGGYGIAYQADVKLQAKNMEYWRVNKDDPKPVGQIVRWTVKCTALNAPPGQEITSYIRYGHGIDEVMELTELGIDSGLIDKKGAWFEWEDQKFQGQEKVRAFFEQDLEARKVLETKLKGMLC